MDGINPEWFRSSGTVYCGYWDSGWCYHEKAPSPNGCVGENKCTLLDDDNGKVCLECENLSLPVPTCSHHGGKQDPFAPADSCMAFEFKKEKG